ncbi:MAG: polyprenol monophosphomannose synthase [Chloroflexi bacterium]|nr:polyprenol monophosphomannose synthase [Chloroflexota bacterium]
MKAMVMLPTYNERDNLRNIVGEILRHRDVSIVVVDDSSPDGTGQIADRLASENPGRIHVIHRKERGRGTAGIAGLRYAREQDVDCVFEMDADLSHDPGQIPEFLERIRDCDVVIGSRFVKGSKAERKPLRKLITDVARVYTQVLLGRGIKDWSGGYKCYRREALRALDFDSFRSRGYSIGMETLYRLTSKGFRCIEIPIEFTDQRRGKSKFSAREVTGYMVNVLRLRLGC